MLRSLATVGVLVLVVALVCNDAAAGRVSRARVEALARSLEDPAARQAATAALDKLGAKAAPAVPLLREIARRKRSSGRYAATWLLGQIGAKASSAIPTLIALLGDGDWQVVANAAFSLVKIHPASRPIAAALAKALGAHSSYEARAKIARALKDVKSPAAPSTVAALVRALKDPNTYVRANAADALGGLRAGSAAAALQAALKHRDARLRRAAAKALASICRASSCAVALTGALGDRDEAVREQAAISLGLTGQATAKVAAALVARCKDRSWHVRQAVIESMGQLRLPQKSVIGALREALSDNNYGVRANAAEALEAIGLPAAAAIPELLAAMKRRKDASGSIPYDAADALAKMGRAGIAALVRELQRQDGRSEDYVRRSLVLAGVAAIPFLVRAIAASGERLVFVRPVPHIPPKLTPRQRHQAKLRGFRLSAADVAAQMGKPAVGPLTKLLSHRDARVRVFAAMSLLLVKFPPSAARAALKRRLKDPNVHVRRMAARALERIEKKK